MAASEQINMDFSIPQSKGNGEAFVNGVIDVTYTNGSASATGSITATSASDTSDNFSTFAVSYDDGTQTYTFKSLGDDNSANVLNFSYVGQAPSTLSSVSVSLGAASYAGSNEPVDSSAVCFCSGTALLTIHGEVQVEDLKVGDIVVTASGAERPIRWLGHRHIRRPSPALHPVRVSAGAFGPDLPSSDLFLSPGHPVLVGADIDTAGGVLVPVMCLINGTTIARERCEDVTYWHVELDEHDILLASGLPAESYLDWGDRAFFGKDSDTRFCNPDHVVTDLSKRCRPVAIDGPLVEAERRRLDSVFAAKLHSHCAWDGADSAMRDAA